MYVIISPTYNTTAATTINHRQEDAVTTLLSSILSRETEEESDSSSANTVISDPNDVITDNSSSVASSKSATHSPLSSLFVRKHEKPRQRIRLQVHHDYDTWREILARHKETGAVRSFFVSDATNLKVWDEPPSGASTIIYL
eukprot:CAMPEP_0172431762 /NCGR_PEP_ID=MMETSP1064-20121228/59854_1 /TAXON_ID=202472 /ORGANISM="Aulacoseira subarctica , Strain CCAP 1002/5" /LENGTH=141 /DNA_ID=CAMNT_0013178635 /DNA_START=261 /DNA_END=686 /DNA_ORIENTATION=+